ncbi:MAG: Gfo/Idh/MocA family oxidoreductase [Anaerolineales bacterium]|nr:Gfo/Idh/MocA family oxidoreductase [Anaerolineales bacterium]
MLNWGFIGAGVIARVFCNALRFSKTGQAYAVASRSGDNAQQMARDFEIPKWYLSYEGLLADEDVDVVYISTIHPEHKRWVLKAAEAGKHILVEKPIGMNAQEAQAMIDAANKNNVFLMEAFMYRCHPQTTRLIEVLRQGVIGQVHMLRATLSFQGPEDQKSRLYAKELGGGSILDVGCYPASAARMIAGVASGQRFLEPVAVKAVAKFGPTEVDLYSSAVLRFENGIIAQLACGVDCERESQVVIYGSRGYITVPVLWVPSSPVRFAEEPLPLDTTFPPSTFTVSYHDERPSEEVTVQLDRDLYTYEADTVANYLQHRQSPYMSWNDTLGNMQLLDKWRQEISLQYRVDRENFLD